MILDELQLNPPQDINGYQNVANLARCVDKFFALSTWQNLFYTLETATNTLFISYLSTPESWALDNLTTQFDQAQDNRGSGR
ncbi:MAG TPA: hypothetical protein VK203_10545 [Nostocaceae cyanobacterium]|nr:hypothetical protein [Nostocaceae cyanobacterium]